MAKLDNIKKSKRKTIWYSVFSFLGVGAVVTAITCPIVLHNKNKSNINVNKPIFLTPIEKFTSEINNINPSNTHNPITSVNYSLADIFEPNILLLNNQNIVNSFVQNPRGFFTIKNYELFDTLFSKMYDTSNSLINIKDKSNVFMGNKFAFTPNLDFYSLKNATQFHENVKNTYNMTPKDLYLQLQNLLLQSKTCLVYFKIIENDTKSTTTNSKEFLLGNFKYIVNVTSASILNSTIVATSTIDKSIIDNLNNQSTIYDATFNPKSSSKTFTEFLKEMNNYSLSIDFIPSINNVEQWLEQNSYSLELSYTKLSNNKFQLSIKIKNNESTIIDSKSINIEYSKSKTNENNYVPYS